MNAYELADELERFESFNGDVFFGTCAITLRQQADQIAELEKRKWSEQDIKNACIGARLSEEDFLRIKAYLPVYSTPQTKPLSDEEIISIRDSCYIQSGIDEWEFDDVNFARAIEERHGIK